MRQSQQHKEAGYSRKEREWFGELCYLTGSRRKDMAVLQISRFPDNSFSGESVEKDSGRDHGQPEQEGPPHNLAMKSNGACNMPLSW